MPIDFDAIIEKQLHDFPAKLKPFIHPMVQEGGMERTWGYFAFAYERAFEVLAAEYCRVYPNQAYLIMPLMQLARHSMELALKNALNECNKTHGAELSTDRHGLVVLYDRLEGFLVHHGMIYKNEPWADFTRKVLVHVDRFDAAGMTFRYPTDQTGKPFPSFEIDIEEMIVAHQNVTLLADATVTMLNERG
jgi:hypothetical protein